MSTTTTTDNNTNETAEMKEVVKPTAEQIFQALETAELRVGTVVEASPVPKSELLKMTVEFGETIGTRTILGRIQLWVLPEDVIGKQFLFVTNLPPRKMKGIDSEGMIFAAKSVEKTVATTVERLALLTTTATVANGTRVG